MEELNDERMALLRWYGRGVFPPADFGSNTIEEEMKKQSTKDGCTTTLVRLSKFKIAKPTPF